VQTTDAGTTGLHDFYTGDELHALEGGGKCSSIPGIDGLAICYEERGNCYYVWAKFGPIETGKTAICTNGACISQGGGALGFKLELRECLYFDPPRLVVSGQACAPLVGCKSFEATLPLS
jgi:hypothetical protein